MILAAGSIFDPVYNFFGAILAFFYGIIPNLGVSIILLTILVMLVMFPLTAKQAKSMMAMQRAQPEIKKLQAKYKNDRAKLNEEMMKFYQENKINPLAGCLPLLVQMPVFLALFRVMRDPYKHIPKGSDLYAAFCTGPKGHLYTNQCNLPKLGLPNPQDFLGMDLSQHATAVTGGFLDALPYFILVGLVVVTGFLQARQSRRNAPNMNSQMAIVTSVLPIAFGLFSLQFPAGLVLYFLVSNTWRLGQQELIMRKITRPGQAALAASAQGRRRDRRRGWRHVGVPARRGRAAEAVPDPGRGQRRRAGGRAGNGAKNGAKNGAAKPSGSTAGAAKGATAKGSPTKGAQAKSTPAGSSSSSSSGERRDLGRPASEQQEAQAALTLAGRVTQQSDQMGGEHVPPSSGETITMEWVETTGRTIAEALDAALDELGVDEEDVEYEVLEEPKSGFLGRLGSSEGRIRARVKPISREKPGERQRRNRRGSSRPRSGGGIRERIERRIERRRQRLRAAGFAPSRARSTSSGRRRSAAAAAAVAAATGDRAARVATRGKTSRQGSNVDTIESDVPIEEQAAAAERFTQGLVDAFDLGAQAKSVIDDEVVVVDVTGDNLGLLVGPKGATLHAIEELVRTVVQRQTDGHGVRIHVDVAGYRAKRREALADFTRNLAEKVLETGKAQALEPMSASDRKVVHDTAGRDRRHHARCRRARTRADAWSCARPDRPLARLPDGRDDRP